MGCMFRTAHPVTAPTPLQEPGAQCPQCGTPVTGIASTQPGRHEFVACGHRASSPSLRSLLNPSG